MYHPTVIAANWEKLQEEYPDTPLRENDISYCSDMTDRLSNAVDSKGRLVRQVLEEEQRFIINELLVTKINFPYWAQRYAFINVEGRGVERMYPLLDSQRFILSRIAELELQTFRGEREDGALLNILKAARQVGVSTLAQVISAHRITTQNNIFGLVASDVPESSAYLFDMLERIEEHLPWWLKPQKLNHVKNTEMLFEGGSHIWVGAGKSTRGTTGQRGQLGRGKALSVVHLSELSTWETPEQIDDALLPTIARSPRVLALFESTAKGRNNWWHKHWKFTREYNSRFLNVFIPWFAEPKYSLDPPEGWEPKATTLEHAKRCEEVSPRWMGRKIVPTREQLYWYESTRAYYEGKDQLKQFLEEYGAVDDDECFQASGTSIFGAQVLDKIQMGARPLMGVVAVAPMKELR